jgi:hypothetical protein
MSDSLKKRWGNMDAAERKAFVAEAMERNHQREYDSALAMFGITDQPAWADLTEEGRERIRVINREEWARMQDLGESIRQAAGTASSTPAAEGG